ncbi:LexA family transcriptional regulator [Algivirga pacifica]|uniref:HTH cro/C1-type domain-containing protein n=1 Tax=Algivirga pacifica TaxID=1162670 RepID=A0ABP9DJ01_9BACT
MAKNQEILLAKNLRYLRTHMDPKRSQEALGDMLGGVTRSAISSYEDGRAEPRLDLLIKIAELFKVDVDDLLTQDLEVIQDSELRKKEDTANYVSGKNLRILTVPTEPTKDEDMIVLVPDKAAAGYTAGFKDMEFIQDLPKYHLPFLPKGKTYRAFEIAGDSMLPISSGSIIIGEYIDDWMGLKDGELVVLVTRSQGVAFKKLYNQLNDKNTVLLKSTNLAYKPYEVAGDDIQEVWKFSAYISKAFPDEENFTSISDLKSAIWELQDQVKVLEDKTND